MQLSARGQQLHRRIALVSEFLGTSFLLHYIQGGSDIVADVSYDLFSSSTASGSANYEIMVWLGALVSSLSAISSFMQRNKS